jgi:regulatory protein
MPRSAPAGPAPSAYQRALRRLAGRDQSEEELRRALARRGHSHAEIDQALARLRRQNYLDDGAYAERFAQSRLAHQGQGRKRIRQGLRERGVGGEQVEAGLAAALREVSEDEVLDKVARRYWRQHTRVEPARRLPRLWGFLLRRGFAPAHVRARLRALWPRWSDALDGLEPAEFVDDDGDGIE